MLYLKNKGGRIVSINSQADYEKYLTLGFTVPAEKEIETEQKAKIEMVQNMKNPIEFDNSVFLATVSQGGADGYGIASAKLLKELKALGIKISLGYNNQKIGFLFHAPYSLLKMENPYRIIYTMFESDKIPDDWKDYLEAADKVLVPSRWCQDVFKKAGVDTEVVPLGYDDNIFTYKKRDNKRKSRKDFVFLHYNAFNARKGFLELFKAFTEEFQPDEPVKLLLKTTLSSCPAGFPLVPSMYPNIQIIYGSAPEEKLAEICHGADAFVFPSRGEGFGQTPLEAMATGLPTIVPSAHGISEYFDPEYMYEVKVADTCPALYSRYKGENVGKMVVCDIEHLKKQMRHIYEHQEEAMEKGKLASEYVKNWTFSKTAQQLKGIFDDAGGKRVVERPLRNVLNLKQY